MLPVDDCVFLPFGEMLRSVFEYAESQNENMKVFSFYHSKCTLQELTWQPHLQGWVCGGYRQTNRWYLDEEQTEITFNYKHSYKSYFCIFQKQQKSVKGLEGTDKLIDDSCHLTKNCFLCILSCLPDTSSCNASGRQAEVFLWCWPLSYVTLCPFLSHSFCLSRKSRQCVCVCVPMCQFCIVIWYVIRASRNTLIPKHVCARTQPINDSK